MSWGASELCGARCVSAVEGPIRTLDPVELVEEGVHVHECSRRASHRFPGKVETWESVAHRCSCGFRWPWP